MGSGTSTTTTATFGRMDDEDTRTFLGITMTAALRYFLTAVAVFADLSAAGEMFQEDPRVETCNGVFCVSNSNYHTTITWIVQL
jgi:hypothetical protein